MKPDKFAAAILIAFDVSEDEFELGLTKIFFRPAKAQILDEIMQSAQNLSDDQMKRIVKWLSKRRVRQLMGNLKVHMYFEKKIRDMRAQNRWRETGRIAGHCGNALFRYLDAAREIIEERRRNAAAMQIQAYYNSFIVRKKTTKQLSKIKKAVKILSKAQTQYICRENVMMWLQMKVEKTRERKRLEEERRKKEEERRKQEEEKRRQEAEKRKEEDEKRRIEKKKQEAEERKRKKQEEMQRREEELKRIVEEEKRQREMERLEKKKSGRRRRGT
eukprot:UN29586